MWAGIIKYPVRSATIALLSILVTIAGWLLVSNLLAFSQSKVEGLVGNSNLPLSQPPFLFLTILSIVGIILYRWRKGYWPHPAITAIILGTILFNWLWWSLNQQSWLAWWNSNTFWPVTIALIFVGIMWSYENAVVKLSRFLLAGGVLVAIIIGVSGFIKSHSTPRQSYPTVTNGVAHSTTNGGGWRNVTGPQKEYVQRRFGAGSVLDRIAACESGYRQFEDSAGTTVVLRSKDPNSSAMGVFQILGKTHGPKADSLGYDLATVEGNSDFASWLYSNPLPGQISTDPWNESKACWGDENSSTPAVAVSSPNVSVIGALDTTFVVPDTTLWTPQIPVGGPRYGLTWRANNNDVSLIVRWSKGGVVHQDTMFVGEEQKYLPVIPQWVQVRPLNQEVATIRFVRKSWY